MDLIGKVITFFEKKFIIRKAVRYNLAEVGKPYKIVLTLAPDQIVVLRRGKYRFAVVILHDGVAELKEVEVDGKVLSKTTEIADAFGIEPRCPVGIEIK